MNLKRVTRSLTAEDWVLLGYLLGVGVWWVCERLTDRAQASPSAEHGGPQQVGGFDRVHLGEQALERIERGEAVTVDRWHGGTVQLKGDVVVDVEEITTEDNAGDNDE